MSMQLYNEECTSISAGKLISDTNYTMKVSFWPDFTFNWLDKNNSRYSWFLRFQNYGLSNLSSNHDRNKPKLVVTTELSLILFSPFNTKYIYFISFVI